MMKQMQTGSVPFDSWSVVRQVGGVWLAVIIQRMAGATAVQMLVVRLLDWLERRCM